MSDNNTPGRAPIADLLSQVLRHPDVPNKIYNAIQDELTDIFNTASNQEWVREYETSTEYIALLLNSVPEEEHEAASVIEFPSIIGD